MVAIDGHGRHYIRHAVAKTKFPTQQVRGVRGSKGSNMVGSKAARQYLESQIGRSLADATPNHTRTEWVWREYTGVKD